MCLDSVASRVFLSPRETSYQASEFNDELARLWIERSSTRRRVKRAYTILEREPVTADDDDKSGTLHAESPPLLPTRILDITPSAHDPEHPVIVLRETSPGERGEYICLSYTWGPQRRHNFPQLARDLLLHHNHDHRDAAGPPRPPLLPALPAAFIDAAHVALKLGIRHLWIDALCIWQDDQDDLKAELGHMHRYFGEATGVVQTSGTRSVDEAFLGEARNSELGDMLDAAAAVEPGGDSDDTGQGFLRIPYHHEHYQHGTGANGQRASEIWGQTRAPGHDDAAASPQQQDKTDTVYIIPTRRLPRPYHPTTEPSASRGWIFQEQNLCRRLLVFPSGGGMLFTTNDPDPSSSSSLGSFSPLSSHAVIHDGQVDHYISPRFTSGGQSRRAAGLPTWGRQRLMDPETDFPEGVKYIPFNDRVLVQIDQMRRVAEMGNKVSIDMFREGSISLNVELRPKMPLDRKGEKCEESGRELRRGNRERRSLGSVEDLDDAGSASADEVVTSDEDIARRLGHVILSKEDIPGSTADNHSLSQRNYSRRPRSPVEETQIAVHRTDNDEPDNDEDSQSRSSTPNRRRRARKTVLTPLSLEPIIHHADGTSSSILVPPTQHPLLEATRGSRTIVIATGPWRGRIFASQLADTWNSLVSEYCTRRLTDSRDRLVALAALASAFRGKYGTDVLGEYHAGVWARFAGEGLLWASTWTGREQRCREKLAVPDAVVDYDDRAPSWSWASVSRAQYPDPKMEIEFGVDYMPLDMVVLSVATQAAEDSPPNGSVLQGGSVRVRGLVMDVWWGMDVSRHREEVVNLFVAETGEQRIGKYGNACPDHGWLYPPDSGEREEVLLLLGRRFVQGVGHNDDHEGECLLLRRREGDADSEEGYVRVGFAGPVFFDFEKEWRSRFKEVELTIY